jgi:hypothetical protein
MKLKRICVATSLILAGSFLIVVGTCGLGFFLSSLILPGANPPLPLSIAFGQQAPNLFAALALPGGVVLFLKGVAVARNQRTVGS